MSLQFEWDNEKARLNLAKHGIDFGDARTVFLDPLAYIFDDKWHSFGEKREIIIGQDDKNRLIRIISARLTTKKECQNYAEYTEF